MDEYTYGNPTGCEALEKVIQSNSIERTKTDIKPIGQNNVGKHGFAAEGEVGYHNSAITKDFDDKSRFRFGVAFVLLPVDDFAKIQARLAGLSPQDFMTDADPYFSEDHAENKLKGPYQAGDLPVPYIEFDALGIEAKDNVSLADIDITDMQEGRHRTYLHKEAENSHIPVLLAVRVRK